LIGLASLERNPDLDTWVRIDAEGTVTLFTGKVELGQGIVTAIARIGAEELGVSLARIRVETADTSRGPEESPTVASRSLEESGMAMRQAAAEARAILLELAASELGVRPSELRVEDGTVLAPRGVRTTFWRLMGGGRFGVRLSGRVTRLPPEAHRIVGKPGPRLDLPGIVTGTTPYANDLVRPGMLHGRVVRPPSPAARLEAVNEEAIRHLPGVVEVIRHGSFVGVVATREEQAVGAAAALKASAQWREESTLPPAARLREWLLEQPAQSYRVVDGVGVAGPPEPVRAPAKAVQTLAATYFRPYLMHASLGPSAALAQWTGEELTVWSHSQGVHVLRDVLARALGVLPRLVRVIHVPGSGCYGHNGADDASFDAALLARAALGRPVLLKWAREDEHAWEPYGSAMVVATQASLDATGRIVDWNHDCWSDTHFDRPELGGGGERLLAGRHADPAGNAPAPPSLDLGFHAGAHRNADPIYALPQRRIAGHLVETRLRVSALRSLGAYANVFAIESFMDELADVAGTDPLEFRLRHLDDPRAQDVLLAAARAADWERQRPDWGRGKGIALARYKNVACYAAVVVELTVDDASAAIRLDRATIAADAGEVVDPSGLANQLEGGFIQAASWTLKEEVTFDDTRVTSLDWRTYPILTFPEVPQIETILIDRPGSPYLGAGEAVQGPTPAAIGNAVFAATGLRLRQTPFTPARVRRAAAAA
jgi:CO/xanthine dehydrogenase Mo-binding subunit